MPKQRRFKELFFINMHQHVVKLFPGSHSKNEVEVTLRAK